MAKVEMIIDSVRRNSLGNEWVVILLTRRAEFHGLCLWVNEQAAV